MPLRRVVPPPPYAKIKTGQYTGDGTISQAITGIGFRPKYVRIWPHFEPPSETVDYELYERTDGFYTEFAFMLHYTYMRFRDNRIISLDSDGFTVDDDDVDSHPNKLNQEYNYLALG